MSVSNKHDEDDDEEEEEEDFDDGIFHTKI
jgi:hypothetical protein